MSHDFHRKIYIKYFFRRRGGRLESSPVIIQSGTKQIRKYLTDFIVSVARAGEPEPLEKKAGAGAAKKIAGSSALRDDKKHKEIVL